MTPNIFPKFKFIFIFLHVLTFFLLLDHFSSGPNFDEMLLLETELPDELMQGAPASWEQQMGSNKPPAQGPGPGQQNQMYNSQLNGGDDMIVQSNVNLQRQHQPQQQQQQLAHLLQQQMKAKGSMNPHMGQMTNKSPNLQGGSNSTVMNNMGGVSMPMSMAPNNNGTNNSMSMQGKKMVGITAEFNELT